MVGLPSRTRTQPGRVGRHQAASSVLAPIAGLYSEVNTIEVVPLVHCPAIPNELSTLRDFTRPGFGYMIHVTEPMHLTYPAPEAAQ